MALTLTSSYTWTSGEVDTATKRNTAGVPTIADGQTYSFGLGSAAAPSVTFNGDTNTGFYSPGADQAAVAVAGVQVASFTSAGLGVTGGLTATTSVKVYSGVGSGLPSANPSGQIAFVTDATSAQGTNSGSTLVTGGSNTRPVYSDGTNWKYF